MQYKFHAQLICKKFYDDKAHMSCVMRIPVLAYVKTKAQNIAADQCLCFDYINSIIPFLSKSEISSL